MDASKPLHMKAYGSIGHLPNSRLGAGDHSVSLGQALICEGSPDRNMNAKSDRVIVEVKLDGSCVAVAMVQGQILALGRAGYLAQTSKYEQHQLFAHWVRVNENRFRAVLCEGERVCGEWLAQAHGTLYSLPHEPFVAFDLMSGHTRMPVDTRNQRLLPGDFTVPYCIHDGRKGVPVTAIRDLLSTPRHGELEPIEGAVWRVEHRGAVVFLAKWVRPGKVDGRYLPDVSGQPAIWNWRPTQATGKAA